MAKERKLLGLAGISYQEFDFYKYSLQFQIISNMAEKGEEISDEVYAYIINPPPVYAAKKDPEMDEVITKHAKEFVANRAKSLKIVALIKAEFYEFLCTQKTSYKKQRNLIGGNINVLITALGIAIAAKLPQINHAIITALIAAFLIAISKMTKKVFCTMIKPLDSPKPKTKKKKSS